MSDYAITGLYNVKNTIHIFRHWKTHFFLIILKFHKMYTILFHINNKTSKEIYTQNVILFSYLPNPMHKHHRMDEIGR